MCTRKTDSTSFCLKLKTAKQDAFFFVSFLTFSGGGWSVSVVSELGEKQNSQCVSRRNANIARFGEGLLRI